MAPIKKENGRSSPSRQVVGLNCAPTTLEQMTKLLSSHVKSYSTSTQSQLHITTTTTACTMKRITQLPISESALTLRICPRHHTASIFAQRNFHAPPASHATVEPITAAGPPPNPPTPSAHHSDGRVARRRKQAELLKRGQDLRSVTAKKGGGSAKTKRFWKHVHVHQVDGNPLQKNEMSLQYIPTNTFK